MERIRTPQTSPRQGGVFPLVQELRRSELKNALLATESLRGETSLEGMIVKSNAHDVWSPPHDRDFRTLGFFLSSVLNGRNIGRLRIFDVGRGTNGYDVSVHLFSNVSGDNGSTYIDLIAHLHHMRWGKLDDDNRPNGLVGWKTAFPSVAHYPVLSWSGFIQNPTGADLIVPTPCIYCKRKVEIPFEVSLLQAESKCGGRRRNSIETEGTTWRVNSADIVVEPASHSWVPIPNSPLHDPPEPCKPHPPDIDPPLLGNQETAIRQHRDAIAKRWSRTDEASFPLISFGWSDNLSPNLTACAEKYLDSVDVGRNVENLRTVANLGDRLNRLSGEVRIAARHVQGIILKKRKSLVAGLDAMSRVDPALVGHVKDSHTRGVLPAYRGVGPETPRVRGPPYNHGQSFDIISKIWKDVRAGRILICTTRTVTENDKIICTPSTLATKKLPGRTLSTEMRSISDVRLVNNFCDK